MSASALDRAIDEIADDFAVLGDADGQLEYLIDLGKKLPPLADAERNEHTKVRGCASQVWLVTERTPDGQMIFRGESDAIIVKGIVAILLRLFSGRTPAEILSADPKAIFERLGLTRMLSPQRSNGLFSMMERMRADARKAETVS
jgi:cysteine desulfuration protein SufE